MDGTRFDRLARTTATGVTRRRAIGAVLAAAGLRWSRVAAATEWVSPPAILTCGGPGDGPCPVGLHCVAPGGACADSAAGCGGICRATTVPGPGPAQLPCATLDCGPGQQCCNACGGVCADLGIDCAAVACAVDVDDPNPGAGDGTAPAACGGNVCAAGEVCCNASCGLCAPVGAACPMIACQ